MVGRRANTRQKGAEYQRNFEISKLQLAALHELEKQPCLVARSIGASPPNTINATTGRSLIKLGFALEHVRGSLKITRAGSEALARSRGWVPK